MRINGKTIPEMPPVVIPIVRGDEVTFMKAQAVDMNDFDKRFPVPTPPMVQRPGQEPISDPTSPQFLKKVTEYSRQRIDYMLVKSFEATEGLTWETIDDNDPSTFSNFEKELQDAGLLFAEIIRIRNAVLEANALDDEKVEAARKSFLAGGLEGGDSSSQKGAPSVTASGGPAKD